MALSIFDDDTHESLGYGLLWSEYAVGVSIMEESARRRYEEKKLCPMYLANARRRYQARRESEHYMEGCRARAALSSARRGRVTGVGRGHVGHVERVTVDTSQLVGRQKKLTTKEIAEIIASTEQTGVLAKRYGVDRHAILYHRRKHRRAA